MKNPCIYSNSLAPIWGVSPEKEVTPPETPVQNFPEGVLWPEIAPSEADDFGIVG